MTGKSTKKEKEPVKLSAGKWAKDFQSLPENIQDSISKLSENLRKKEQKRSIQQLTREFVEILSTDKQIRKIIDDRFKYQTTLTILSNRYTPKEVDLENIIHKEPLGEAEKKKLERVAKSNFRSQNLMFMIRRELEKDHVGDSKGKLTTFLVACSGKLPSKYRVSMALRGDSSVGKTNLMKTVLRHLPKFWYAFGTRFTRASLEDDVEPFYIIAFSEKTQDDQAVIESLKQLTEDGLQTWKHEKDSNKLKEVRFIDRKASLYSSTEKETDEELATRYIVYTVTRHPYKINKVIESIKDKYSNIEQQIAEETREKKPTWITIGLKELKDFDKIVIPYANFISFNNDYPRCQRDTKRFLNLIAVCAWVNQYNRLSYKEGDKNVLVANVDDFFWTSFLTMDIFKQTLTNIDKDIETLISTYKYMVEKGKVVVLTSSGEEESPLSRKVKPWVRRSDFQREMDISLNTMKKRCSVLKDKGMLFERGERRGNRVYITIDVEPFSMSLIKYDFNKIYFVLKNIEENVFNTSKKFTGKSPSIMNSMLYKKLEYKPKINISLKNNRLTVKSLTKRNVNKDIINMIEYMNKNMTHKKSLDGDFSMDEFFDESDVDWEI